MPASPSPGLVAAASGDLQDLRSVEAGQVTGAATICSEATVINKAMPFERIRLLFGGSYAEKGKPASPEGERLAGIYRQSAWLAGEAPTQKTQADQQGASAQRK